VKSLRAPHVDPPVADALAAAFDRIREELHVPGPFSPELEREATAAAARGPVMPPGVPDTRVDAREIPFVSIDPPGSRDLDQALHLERRAKGYRVHYAIADVVAFVTPGSALERESWARGVTIYMPDYRAPVLPEVLSEGGASLRAGDDRPALVWTIDLDADGETAAARLERATVRNRAALSYPEVQAALDSGRADDWLLLLREVGEHRREIERARGGVSLDLPQQEVVTVDGGFGLAYDAPLPVEGWNAQLSLLAGMEAATILVDAQAGLLRTLPAPEKWLIDRLHRVAHALHMPWPKGTSWGDIVRGVDRHSHRAAAFLIQAARLLRGAGYLALDATNTAAGVEIPIHAGVGAPYAHVTAPLRRVADRYSNEIVVAHCAGREPPAFAVEAPALLRDVMLDANRRDATVERTVVDTIECAVLVGHEGEVYDGIVVDQNQRGIIVQLAEPAVVMSVVMEAALGSQVTLRLEHVDPVARRATFVPSRQ
jgi:exoribonuclease R